MAKKLSPITSAEVNNLSETQRVKLEKRNGKGKDERK